MYIIWSVLLLVACIKFVSLRSFLTYLFHKPKFNSYLKTANDMKVSIKRHQDAVDIGCLCVQVY